MGKKMRKFNEVVRLAEFDRDLKKLLKKYRTLEEDLSVLIDTALFRFHKIDSAYPYVVRIENLGTVRLPVFKVRRFACRAIKGAGSNTGLRLIYAYDSDADRIELVEIYMKSDQAVEDKERIIKHYGT